jgi:tRNA(fMet)-specific endonuclease VapC
MKYLLDTNMCIYIINKRSTSVLDTIRSKNPDEISISSITRAELNYGAERSKNPHQNRIAILEFLISFSLMDFDQSAASYYGKIRKRIESKGTPIGPMDLLLASQAAANNLIFVTHNIKEFERIDNLRLENWLR